MAQDDGFLHRGNVRRFEQKLSEATDESERRVLKQLLAAERRRVLAEANASDQFVRSLRSESSSPNAEE
jgi:hypothetical protein